MPKTSYTGRDRARETPKSVRRAELAARVLIGAGGVGTILAVTLIFVFLVVVVAPLFAGGEVETATTVPAQTGPARIIASGMDEYRLMTWSVDDTGTVRLYRLDDGSLIDTRKLVEGDEQPTAWSFPPGTENALMAAFADGSVRPGTIRFRVDYLDPEKAPAELRSLKVGEVRRYEDALVDLTRERQVRFVRLVVAFEKKFKATDAAIKLIDFTIAPQGRVFAALSADGKLGVYHETTETNMATGEEETTVDAVSLPYERPAGRGEPAYLKLAGIGNIVFLVWEDGHTIRFDARSATNARAAETFEATGRTAKVTSVRFLVGKTTLVVGDGKGVLRAWFPTKPADAGTVDGTVMEAAQRFSGPAAAVTALSPSPQTRLLAAGYADGSVRLWQTTTGARVLEGRMAEPVAALVLAPRSDGIVGLGRTKLTSWAIRVGHPEATMASLFTTVWYEGYPGPQHVWQSTGGTDDFEPKLGMMPLVFGTLKATLYSMLIAVPIALLAAIFTSEFMSARLKAPVKSVIEMMASLPSVVLGFIAALVIAPVIQDVLPQTLAALITVPFMLLVGARLWQLLPQEKCLAWSGAPRFLAIVFALPAGIVLAALLGPTLESLFYAGDIKGWLNGRVGGVGTGWTLILLPVALIAVALAVSRWLGPRIRALSTDWSRERCAAFDIARMAGVLVAGLALAAFGGWVLGKFGWDPRGELIGVEAGTYTGLSIVGTYAQRNAMIVGFVMGFAIVPIIYTLAEDALASVPSQLREGSLAAGATQWQTAVRIIVPTATSGLFGAMMVGLGRAVGETMIVLMAAGNTPLMDWNVFAGFRTLSANIAVELPEAVRNSTHYRTLFLAALVLFAMTFLINTFAEMVRRRFRARYAEQL